MNRKIIMVAAASTNNALGLDNKLLWHLPDDFKRFKEMTIGHYIVMGRKTFESFPKPLPNRTHIIITRQKNYVIPGHIVVDSIEKAIDLLPENENSFIIGGGEIYQQAMEYVDKIELTRIDKIFEADTFFPEIDNSKWQLIHEEFHPMDEKHLYQFSYQTFTKKNIPEV
jgi:dihydrofolate reductase